MPSFYIAVTQFFGKKNIFRWRNQQVPIITKKKKKKLVPYFVFLFKLPHLTVISNPESNVEKRFHQVSEHRLSNFVSQVKYLFQNMNE